MNKSKVTLESLVRGGMDIFVIGICIMGMFGTQRNVGETRNNQTVDELQENVANYMTLVKSPNEESPNEGYYNTFFCLGTTKNEQGEVEAFLELGIDMEMYSNYILENTPEKVKFSDEYLTENGNLEKRIVIDVEKQKAMFELVVDLELSVGEDTNTPILKMVVQENYYYNKSLEYEKKRFLKYEFDEEGQIQESQFSEIEEVCYEFYKYKYNMIYYTNQIDCGYTDSNLDMFFDLSISENDIGEKNLDVYAKSYLMIYDGIETIDSEVMEYLYSTNDGKKIYKTKTFECGNSKLEIIITFDSEIQYLRENKAVAHFDFVIEEQHYLAEQLEYTKKAFQSCIVDENNEIQIKPIPEPEETYYEIDYDLVDKEIDWNYWEENGIKEEFLTPEDLQKELEEQKSSQTEEVTSI